VQMPNMKADNVERFYDEDDDEFTQVQRVKTPQGQAQFSQTQGQNPQGQNPQGQNPQGQAQFSQGQTQVQGQGQTQVQLDGEYDEFGQVQPPVTDTTFGVEPVSVQGQPVEGEIVPGMVATFNDRPGEVLAYVPAEQMVVLRLSDTQEEVQIHESKITIIGDKIFENENSLKSSIGKLITETKKRKVAENTQPHFLQFLTEKNKQLYYSLNNDDKEKVKMSLNESNYYSENQVLKIMSDALSVKKTFEDVLVENIPSDLQPIYENLSNDEKKNILLTAKLYPNLDTPAKIEAFWNSRKLENYSLIKESKQVLTKNQLVDNSTLSDTQLDRFYQRLKNLE
jgi:hypothetical protein